MKSQNFHNNIFAILITFSMWLMAAVIVPILAHLFHGKNIMIQALILTPFLFCVVYVTRKYWSTNITKTTDNE